MKNYFRGGGLNRAAAAITALLVLTSLRGAADAANVSFQQQQLPEIGLNGGLISSAPASDGYHFAYEAQAGAEHFVVIDGVRQKSYDRAVPCRWSDDGRHLAYLAIAHGKNMVVIDGKEGPPFDQILGLPEFAKVTDRVAYVGRRGNEQCAVVDGQLGDEYDKVSYIMFSLNGKRFAYLGETAGNTDLVIDGHPNKDFHWVGDPIFSPDGAHLDCIAIKGGNGQPRQMFHVTDGKRGPTFDLVTFADMRAGSITYAAIRAGASYYVVNGVVHPIVATMIGAPLPYRGHLAYEAMLGNKSFAVLDGKPQPQYDTIGTIMFSPDGGHFAYTAKSGGQPKKTGGKWQVVIDGHVEPAFDSIDPTQIYFSADGKHWAYWAKDHNRMFVMADGKPGTEYDVSPAFGRIIFSADGKHLAYVAHRGPNTVMVVDGHELLVTEGLINDYPPVPFRRYEDLPPFFTPKGDHLIYLVDEKVVGNQIKARVYVDDAEGPEHMLILCAPCIRSDGKLEYLALGAPDGKSMYRVTISIAKQ
jgi:hypothetical protein